MYIRACWSILSRFSLRSLLADRLSVNTKQRSTIAVHVMLSRVRDKVNRKNNAVAKFRAPNDDQRGELARSLLYARRSDNYPRMKPLFRIHTPPNLARDSAIKSESRNEISAVSRRNGTTRFTRAALEHRR